MKYLTTENYLKKGDNIYSIVILAAKRTTSLNRGSKSLLPNVKDLKPAIIALKEIAEGKIVIAFPENDSDEKK